MGVRIAIEPHDVPVAKEINIAIINTRKGSSAGVIQASVMDTTYSAVPKTSVTNPIDHAKTMMIKAGTIVLIPPRIVSSIRSEEHTSELQSRGHLVCRLLL